MRVSPKRPRTISLILLVLIVMGFVQAAKVVALSEQSALLLDLQIRPDPRLRMLIAVVWMAVFWILAFALWRRKTFTRWLIPLLFAVYVLYELALLAIFAPVPISTDRWIRNGLVVVVLASFAFWVLNRRAAKPYYLEDGQADG